MHRFFLLLACVSCLVVVSCVPLCDETGSLTVSVVLKKAIPSVEPTLGVVTENSVPQALLLQGMGKELVRYYVL